MYLIQSLSTAASTYLFVLLKQAWVIIIVYVGALRRSGWVLFFAYVQIKQVLFVIVPHTFEVVCATRYSAMVSIYSPAGTGQVAGCGKSVVR